MDQLYTGKWGTSILSIYQQGTKVCFSQKKKICLEKGSNYNNILSHFCQH